MEYALPRATKKEERFMVVEGKKIYTVADIEALPEGERAELIDGEMFMMASPTVTHQDLSGWLYLKICLFIAENKGKCKVYYAPFAVYIMNDQYNYAEPDLVVICDRDKLDEKGCHGAPDWIIEIVSPSSRHMDQMKKLALYRNAGVREYWLVNPVDKSITVYRMEQKKEPETYSFADKVEAGIYDDFSIDFSAYEFLNLSQGQYS